jgi:uncharacterized protein involved in type VI secretion and phage assembly
MSNIDLEAMREVFKDQRTHIAVGKISGTDISSDRSVMRVKVVIFPESREIIARMTWEQVGPESGIFGFPIVGDLVLVGFAEGDDDQAFVLKRLTSKEDKIPVQAMDGSTVLKSLAGKSAHVLSDTSILLGRGGDDPDEPLVLGNVFKEAYSEDLNQTAIHQHVGNLGYLTQVPNNADQFVSLKVSPVDDDLMLSDLSKTEK